MVYKICNYCGKKYNVIPAREDISKYCSKNCYYKARKNFDCYHGENGPYWKERITLICKYCGKKFKVYERRKHQKFCSPTCYHKATAELPEYKGRHYKEQIKKYCMYCTKEFIVMPYENRRRYCCRDCYIKALSEFEWYAKGKYNGNWNGGWFPYYGPEWHKIRKKVLKRANYKSEISGKKSNKLDVHHKICFSFFIQKYIDLCLKYIPNISVKSFKILSYELIPNLIYEEANKLENLILLTEQEHSKFERMPITFFDAIMGDYVNANF